jgi:hypothetical protein
MVAARMVTFGHFLAHWSYPKPSAAVPAAWFFITRRLYESKLSSAPRNKKTRTVRAGFVTPSGFKPETF